jgi:transposase
MVRTILRSWGQPAGDPRNAASEEEAAETETGVIEAHPRRVRLVAYFNPWMYVDQYRRAQEHLAEIHSFVAELNEELSGARQSRKEESTRRKVLRKLERYDYSDLFDLRLVPITVRTRSDNEVRSFRCELSLKQKLWERRQRYNGFVLLVARADVPGEAEDLVRLYRAKDAIEKDFQTIKSVVKLRPIFHHTDPKVVAHVTLCMLALALERALEQRLRRGQVKLTAPACLEILETCHLNELHERAAGRGIYSVTRPTTAQREVLAALDMAHLVEDSAVSRALIPRFVPTL